MNDMAAVRAAAPPLFLLVTLSAIQPIALNIIAPSTPALAHEFATDYATVQLTLTIFLLAVALSQLVTGPLSDRAGRRPVILFSLAAFVIGCLAAAIAPTIEALIAARVVQAIGSGAAFALARAIIRDTSARDEAASRIGYMMVAMLIAPMLSPALGSLIDRAAGWHAIFLFMAALGAGALAIVWRRLPETNLMRDPEASVAKLASAFPLLLRSRAFLAYTLSTCSTAAQFFAFVAGAPHVVVESMGNEPQVYALWFILVSSGYAAGNFASGRYAGLVGTDRMILLGSVVTLAGSVIQLAGTLATSWSPAFLFIPALAMAFGNGATIPSATASALSIRPELAGAASGLIGALQLGCAAIVSYVTGHVVTSYPRGLVVIMFLAAAAGLLALALQRSAPARRLR